MKVDKEFLFELLRLLKPEFYNRLTWFVVGSGVLLMSTPLWQSIVSYVLEKEMGWKIDVSGNMGWGFSLVLVGLTYHIITNSLPKYLSIPQEKQNRELQRQHDTKIFESAAEKLNNSDLLAFYDRLLSENAYFHDRLSPVYSFCELLSHSDNAYIDSEIKNAASVMVQDIYKLLNFMSWEFDIYPSEQPGPNYRSHLYPRGNWDLSNEVTDESSDEYDRLERKLYELVETSEGSYKSYRDLIKNKLFL